MTRFKATAGAIVVLVGFFTATLPGRQGGSEALVQADLQAYMTARTAGFSGITNFSFGVYSDIHMCECSTNVLTRAQWAGLLTTWRDLGNLFGVIVGDLGYDDFSHVDNVMSGPAAVPSAPPVFYSMGNHENGSFGKRSWIDALYPNAVRPSSWTPLPTPPGNADHTYWSFNVGPSTHFIFLDGNSMTWDGITARIVQTLGQAQLTWLKNDILANANKNILVFVHEPIDQQTTNTSPGSTPELLLTDRAALLEMLAAHPKQKYIFSGHLHSHPGITRWKGVNSVHVQTGPLPMGLRVTVAGETITLTGNGTSTVTDFDAHPMNQTVPIGGQQVLRVAEDGANAGNTRLAKMVPVGPENGVSPTAGSLMLKSDAMTWYAPRFISEQLVKIEPGMKFSYDIYLYAAVPGKDAVTVQPYWYVKDGSLPPLIFDQNFIPLSRRPRDGAFFAYNDDTPSLGGRANGAWYHREFDLTPMAGNYADGIYLTSSAANVNVGAIYVDNIRFTWPATGTVVPPPRVNVALASRGAIATPSSTYSSTYSANAAINDERRSIAGSSGGAWADATPGIYPDWLEVAFSGVKTINQVDVFTVPDVQTTPTFPMLTTTFSLNGLVDFQVQYWTGSAWQTVPGGAVTGNNLVWRQVTFSPISTSKIRIYVTNAMNMYSRIAEVEAWAIATAPATNVPPSVSLTSPASGATFAAPASLTLSATAADGDGAVTSVAFYANGSLVGTDTNSPYSVPWTATALGAYTLTAVATDNVSATTTSAAANITVGGSVGSAAAAFVGADVATQGTWIGSYGGQGYNVIGEATSSYPSYASVTPTGQSQWIWSSATTDVRALQRPSGVGRIAGVWYGSVFDIEVNLQDGLAHRVALYALDWDGLGRSQRVDILDAASLTVLDTRTLSNFQNGQYLTWSLTGRVKIRVTLISGANAVVSGLFFNASSSSPSTSAVFQSLDTTTQGTWIGSYGGQGYNVIGEATSSYPSYASVTPTGQSQWVWSSATTDVRALQRPSGVGRIAGVWYGSVFDIEVNLQDGLAHRVALYALDWDGLGRSQRVDILDAASLTVLDTRTMSNFQNGQYLTWSLTGRVKIRVTLISGANAVVSGLFFNASSSSPSTSAVFQSLDTTTQGTWIGSYGGQGYNVIGEATSSYPSYASVTPTGHSQFIWSSATTDVRALQRPGGVGRIAGVWYGSVFDIEVNLQDGLAHRVALYALDWDGLGRSQRVDILDAASLTVLDTRTLSNFQNGQYLTWSLTGRVKIRVTLISGANAVVSGLFFNASPTSAVFQSLDTTTQGSWIGRFGSSGYNVVGDAASNPSSSTVTSTGSVYLWSGSTADVRALQRASGVGRVAGTWYGNVFDINVRFGDGLPHKVTIYGLDWDVQARSQRIDVLNTATLAVLDSRTLSGFQAGQYLTWTVTGDVILRVTRLAGPNAVVSGLFFGPG